jgi:hypothetical protein
LAAEVLSEAIVMGVNSTDGERISG